MRLTLHLSILLRVTFVALTITGLVGLLPAESTSRAEPSSDASAEDDTLAEDATSIDDLLSNDDEPAAEERVKYELKYKLKKGEAVRWEVTHQAVIDSTIQGTNQTAQTRSKSVKVWRVSNVTPSGEITLVHSVASIDMWQKMQGRQEVHYNSLTDSAPPAGYEDVAKAVGTPLTEITLDRHGNVLKRLEKHPQPNAGSTLLTMPLPDGPVSLGYKWHAPLEMTVMLPGGSTKKIQTRQQFTLKKVSSGVATIAVETQVLTPLHDPAIEAQLVQRLSDGTVRFDIEQGRVLSQQMDLDRRVIGFSGPSSSMHYVSRFTEDILPIDEATPKLTRRPVKASSKTADSDPTAEDDGFISKAEPPVPVPTAPKSSVSAKTATPPGKPAKTRR